MTERKPAPPIQQQLTQRPLSPGMQRPPVAVVSRQQSVPENTPPPDNAIPPADRS